jgi:light-regulated signal transduction histidine kinase (bacteriophytochrome)
MGELIDELLNLSRVSHAPLIRQVVPIAPLVEKVVAGFGEPLAKRQVELVIEPGLEAYADARFLRIVFDNILENCWKFTANEPRARVQIGRVAGTDPPVYFVTDNGVGFDQTHAHRLFQPFQRLHTEQEFSGTGIGLAIVHRIVTRHGGRVWAESKEAHGASFYFTLTGKT